VRGDLELGLVGAKVPHPHVSYHPLVEDELVLAVAADHPWARQASVPLEALQEAHFIQRERGSGSRLVVEEALLEHGIDVANLRVIAEMGTTEAIKQSIKAGVGLSFISRVALLDEIRAGSICAITIEGVTMRRHFSVVRHTGRTLSPLAQTFEAFLYRLGPLHLLPQDSAS
jgi:DNA-binding transcriptional LysR family regulator